MLNDIHMIPGIISQILASKSPNIWMIEPEADVFTAIQRMAEHNTGALLVVADGALLGVVSERDYTRKVALKGKSSRETKVREIIDPPHAVTPAHTVEECMKLMTTARVRHLPVLEAKKIVGIVSIGDLVNWAIQASNILRVPSNSSAVKKRGPSASSTDEAMLDNAMRNMV